jgi:hypothetical protein
VFGSADAQRVRRARAGKRGRFGPGERELLGRTCFGRLAGGATRRPKEASRFGDSPIVASVEATAIGVTCVKPAGLAARMA